MQIEAERDEWQVKIGGEGFLRERACLCIGVTEGAISLPRTFSQTPNSRRNPECVVHLRDDSISPTSGFARNIFNQGNLRAQDEIDSFAVHDVGVNREASKPDMADRDQ